MMDVDVKIYEMLLRRKGNLNDQEILEALESFKKVKKSYSKILLYFDYYASYNKFEYSYATRLDLPNATPSPLDYEDILEKPETYNQPCPRELISGMFSWIPITDLEFIIQYEPFIRKLTSKGMYGLLLYSAASLVEGINLDLIAKAFIENYDNLYYLVLFIKKFKNVQPEALVKKFVIISEQERCSSAPNDISNFLYQIFRVHIENENIVNLILNRVLKMENVTKISFFLKIYKSAKPNLWEKKIDWLTEEIFKFKNLNEYYNIRELIRYQREFLPADSPYIERITNVILNSKQYNLIADYLICCCNFNIRLKRNNSVDYLDLHSLFVGYLCGLPDFFFTLNIHDIVNLLQENFPKDNYDFIFELLDEKGFKQVDTSSFEAEDGSRIIWNSTLAQVSKKLRKNYNSIFNFK